MNFRKKCNISGNVIYVPNFKLKKQTPYFEGEPPHPQFAVARPRDEVASPFDDGKVPDLGDVAGEGGEAVLDVEVPELDQGVAGAGDEHVPPSRHEPEIENVTDLPG